MENSTSAQESLRGYFYQLKMALLTMLKSQSQDGVISIEKLDDFATEKEGEVTLVQTKHKESELTNFSPEIWKSFRNWAEYFNIHEKDGANMNFFLMTTQSAKNNTLSSFLGPRGRDVSKAIEIMDKVAEESENKDNKAAIELYKSMSLSQKKRILNMVFIIVNAPDNLELDLQIEKEIIVASRNKTSIVREKLWSWWLSRVEHHIENKTLGIPNRDVYDCIYTVSESLHPDNLPEEEIDPIDETVFKNGDMRFIKQLELLKINDERIRHAITNYQKAIHNRTYWIDRDLVSPNELTKYDSNIKQEWLSLFLDKTQDVDEQTPAQVKLGIGKAIYSFVENEFPNRSYLLLRERFRSPFILRGSAHKLADDLEIGWHPDFKKVLLEEKND